jgi:integrase/recombinase XerD
MRRELISTYLFYLQVERSLSAQTCETYRYQLKKLKIWARHERKSYRILREQDIRRWIMQMAKAGLMQSSIAVAISAAKGFFNFLVDGGYVRESPLKNVELPEIVKKLPRGLSVEDINLLLSQPNVKTFKGLLDRTIMELLMPRGFASQSW